MEFIFKHFTGETGPHNDFLCLLNSRQSILNFKTFSLWPSDIKLGEMHKGKKLGESAFIGKHNILSYICRSVFMFFTEVCLITNVFHRQHGFLGGPSRLQTGIANRRLRIVLVLGLPESVSGT